MNQTMLFAIITTVIGTASPAYPQDMHENNMVSGKPVTISSLDQRVRQCTSSDNCSLQEQLEITVKINREIGNTLSQIDSTCREMNYVNCIENQVAEKEELFRRYNQMSVIMDKIYPDYKTSEEQADMDDVSSYVTRQEPAAGDVEQDSEGGIQGWFKRLWGGAKEPVIPN